MDALVALVDAFEAHSGARLVFRAEDLASPVGFDVLAPLPESRREAAARIALAEARRYPVGYLHAAGIETVGVFAAVGDDENDGFHAWNTDIGAYAYYGGWNGSDSIAAAYYADSQLPLTLNHEIFHAVDGASGSEADDARYVAALEGQDPWPALAIAPTELLALRAAGHGAALSGAVSDYAAKDPGEDQAETARWVLAHLPDALVQAARHPTRPGSQRILHVLAEYEAVEGGPTVDDWVDVALGRAGHSALLRWQRTFRPDDWVVWGREQADGANPTLRSQVTAYGEAAQAVAERGGVGEAVDALRFLAAYHGYIAEHWTVTEGTRARFEDAIEAVVAALPTEAGPLANALAAATLEDLADLPGDADPAQVTGLLAAAGVPTNRYLARVDEAVDDAVLPAIRRVQPAMVRVTTDEGYGSGVNLAPDGRVLTAAHVPEALGAHVQVGFPDGTWYRAVCTRFDARSDLAILSVEGGMALPTATVAPHAPKVDDPVVVIGQPGAHSPYGGRTGYTPFHVSVGAIRAFADDRRGDQSLGGTSHDAWTYWGHSGAPLLDTEGRIVGLHNSWDPATAMRHAVTWEAITAFLAH